MIDDSKISGRQEQELSMDEILSSIRNIITEDQETKSDARRTFSEDSTTNPSGARMMSELPTFDRDDDFVLPNFQEPETERATIETKRATSQSIFPDEDFETRHHNERSFREQSDPYYRQEQFARDAALSTEDRISKALRGIVESYGQRQTVHQAKPEPTQAINQRGTSEGLMEGINAMMEKIIVARIEEWLHTHLPGILEKAILRELERVVHQMKI